jgi:uncharacterized OB-fold protein
MAEKVPIRDGIFIDGPDGETLLANKCKSCGQIFFPKVKFCLSCFNEGMEDVILSRRGELYSYSTAYMPSSYFKPPHTVGYINLPEGLRIFAPLKVEEGQALKVGIEMEVVIEKLWQEGDKEVMGYKFKPV